MTPGTRLGSYEVVAQLGAGGMGEVYRARDLKLGRDVALKVLSASLARTPDRLARFEREARRHWRRDRGLPLDDRRWIGHGAGEGGKHARPDGATAAAPPESIS
jgi:hypothetical protein